MTTHKRLAFTAIAVALAAFSEAKTANGNTLLTSCAPAYTSRTFTAKDLRAEAANYSDLENAVHARNLALTRTLVGQGATISFRALKFALQNQETGLEFTRILLDGGADVNAIGKWEKSDFRDGFATPLTIALLYNDSPSIAPLLLMLFAKGARTNLALPDGTTALDVAMNCRNSTGARLLVDRGANFAKYRKQFLSNAIRLGDAPLIATLKKRGALPSKLSFAQFDFPTSPVAVKTILTRGGNSNERHGGGFTILHFAVEHGEFDSVRMLLDAGADPNARANYSRSNDSTEGLSQATPAFVVGGMWDEGDGGELKTLNLLLVHGANPNAIETHNGFSLLMWSAVFGHHKVEAIDTLLKAGARINYRDFQGQTALHLAALNDETASVKALIKANPSHAFLERRDNHGRTALLRSVACPVRELEKAPASNDIAPLIPTIAALVEAGANIHSTDEKGLTVLHLAADDLQDGVAKAYYFWQKGFKKIDVRDSDGKTPLFRACENANVKVAGTLLSLGANPDVVTKSGSSPRKILSQTVHLP